VRRCSRLQYRKWPESSVPAHEALGEPRARGVVELENVGLLRQIEAFVRRERDAIPSVSSGRLGNVTMPMPSPSAS